MRRLIVGLSAFVLLAGGFTATLAVRSADGAQSSSGKPAAQPAKAAPNAATLDKLLAPIALYPDQLLAQMLLCSAKPAKVAALSEWLASHPSEKGTALQEAAGKAGFEPEFVALSLFPDVVNAMAGRMDWTTQLGEAFASNRSAVFDSIQRLRAQAQKAGTLKDSPQQEVETKKTSSGQDVIVIEPANPQVVYVPQYNPTVVYTQPSTTVVVQESSSNAVAAGVIGFTAGIAIGAAIDNDYYGPYGWGYRGGYMYNDAWDDYYDAREDAREDWSDHREDIVEDRSERAEDARENRTERSQNTQEQRTDRQQNRQENRPEASQAQKDQARTNAQARQGERSTSTASASTQSRGYSGSGTTRTAPDRSGTKSDAFSGYSSGKSERAASQRGKSSRSSSARSSGGRRR